MAIMWVVPGLFLRAGAHEILVNCELPLRFILVIKFPFGLSSLQWLCYLPVRVMIILIIDR